MKFFNFTEMPYPYVPEDYPERYGSARVILPNREMDPVKAADLYRQYLEQHIYADELGLHILLNEHHQTITCTNAACPVMASVLIPQTKKAQILLLGHPLPHRENPLRVAEETAMMDLLSRGRILCGFVRGVGMENHPSNVNPVENRERFYEAYNLIMKAWTTGEPFSWEGKYFHYRYVNVWPRPYQQPHPPIWTTGGSNNEQVAWAARNQLTYACFFVGFENAARIFDKYRQFSKDAALSNPPASRFGYMAMVYTAETDEQAEREGKELLWYLHTYEPHWFKFPPGFRTVEERKKIYQPHRYGGFDPTTATWEELTKMGVVIAGNPDTVARRIREFQQMSGAGNLLMMTQAGFFAHEKVMKSLELFSREVLPQVQDLGEENEVSLDRA